MRRVLVDCFYYKFYMDEDVYNTFTPHRNVVQKLLATISGTLKSIQQTLNCVRVRQKRA